MHQPTAFAHKLLQLSGVSLFWDEFSASAKSSPVCSTAPVVRKMKHNPPDRCGGVAQAAVWLSMQGVLGPITSTWEAESGG